jgi:periplasmic divalent cation tolerance protein
MSKLPKPEPVAIPAPNAVLLVMTIAPDRDVADTIAMALVDERLAACVNILAPCRSIYRWQGKVEHADEIPMLIKTTRDRFEILRQRLKALHPYDVPEIIACKPVAGWPPYANWVIAQTRPARRGA